VIEAVDAMSLIRKTDGGEGIIRVDSYEKNITKSLSNYLDVLKTLGVETQVFLFVTLLGVKGYFLLDELTVRRGPSQRMTHVSMWLIEIF
jgi:hypothetical protein